MTSIAAAAAAIALWPERKIDAIDRGLGSEGKVEASILYLK